MLRQFFNHGVETSFILSIINNFDFPIYDTVRKYDYIIKDAIYIYKSKVIKCTKTGYLEETVSDDLCIAKVFDGSATEEENSKVDLSELSNILKITSVCKKLQNKTWRTLNYYEYLVSDDNKEIILQKPLVSGEKVNVYYSTSQNVANYDIVENYISNTPQPNITKKVVCNCSYYDLLTHNALGDYLRYLRDVKHLNLMLLYICFDYIVHDNMSLISSFEYHKPGRTLPPFTMVSNPDTKVVSIPVKFNRDYTIALDSTFAIRAIPILWSENGYIRDSDGSYFGNKYTDSLNRIILNGVSMTSPKVIRINTDDINLYRKQKYLRLFLELPKSSKTSIIVLEGDYSHSKDTFRYYYNDNSVFENETLDRILVSLPELTLMDSNILYAYSSKLIQYLLQNAVTNLEKIENNISTVLNGILNQLLTSEHYIKIDSDGELNSTLPELLGRFLTGDLVANDLSEVKDKSMQLCFLNGKIFPRTLDVSMDDSGVVSTPPITVGYDNYINDVWDNRIRYILYQLCLNNKSGSNIDLLGYADRDVEKFLSTGVYRG